MQCVERTLRFTHHAVVFERGGRERERAGHRRGPIRIRRTIDIGRFAFAPFVERKREIRFIRILTAREKTARDAQHGAHVAQRRFQRRSKRFVAGRAGQFGEDTKQATEIAFGYD